MQCSPEQRDNVNPDMKDGQILAVTHFRKACKSQFMLDSLWRDSAGVVESWRGLAIVVELLRRAEGLGTVRLLELDIMYLGKYQSSISRV